MARANRLKLHVHLLARDSLRYSPAGVPILNCKLQHQSQQIEAGIARTVELEIDAVAIGSVAQSLEAVPPESELEVTGFLARKYRSGPALELHLTDFELKD